MNGILADVCITVNADTLPLLIKFLSNRPSFPLLSRLYRSFSDPLTDRDQGTPRPLSHFFNASILTYSLQVVYKCFCWRPLRFQVSGYRTVVTPV